MKSEDMTIANVLAYADRAVKGDRLYGAEALIFNRIIRHGDRALDIGCGTGRVTRALARAGATVDACDMESRALDELKNTIDGLPITVRMADVRDMPYEDECFDIVVFAFNGLDFLHPIQDRTRAIREMNRLLKPGGHLVISSHNSIGTLFSPRGMFRIHGLTHRIISLTRGRFMDPYTPDLAGLMLYQGTPRQVIRQIKQAGPYRLVSCLDQTGRIASVPLLTMFSPWPYYHFQKLPQ
jgi:ubiquinone/menaquinone biosynthesis C-methylase UbiE